MLMNVISAVEGPDGRLFQSIYNALETSFAEVRVYCAGGEAPDRLQNLMVAAFPERRADTEASAVTTAQAGSGLAEKMPSMAGRLTMTETAKAADARARAVKSLIFFMKLPSC